MNLGSSFQNMANINPIEMFIVGNPMFLLVIFGVIFLIYIYVTSDFRLKTPHFFAYSTRLDEQVSYWTEKVAEDIMNLYKLDISSINIPILKGLFGETFNTNLIAQLKEKTNAIFHEDTNVIGDFSKMEELLQERLTWSFVTVHDDENIYDQNSQTRYAVFDLLVFMTNNFSNLKEQNMLFYLNHDFEDNIKYFVNKAKNNYDKNIVTTPSLNKNANNDVHYIQKSTINYDKNYFEGLTNILTTSEDGELPEKIDENIINDKYKDVLFSVLNKVIDLLKEMKEKNNKTISEKLFEKFDNWVENNPTWKKENSVIKKNDKIVRKFFYTKENYFSSYFDKLTNNDNKDEVDTETLKRTHFDEFMKKTFDHYITKTKTMSTKNEENGLFEGNDRFKFEKLLFEFETEFGHGMLMKDYSFIEQTMVDYHNVVNLHHYNKNTAIVQNAYKYKDSVTEDMKNALLSLHRLHISLSTEFPKILHYDTKHSVDIGRLNMYYDSLFKKLLTKVNYYINEFTNGLPALYTKEMITMHKKFDNFLLNMLINVIQTIRDYFKWVRDNLGKYISDTVKGATEGYKDPKVKDLIESFNTNLTEKQNEYRDAKNNVVEPFVGKLIKGIGNSIAKPFMIVIQSFKIIFKILTLITNPIAIIKLMVALVIMLITIVLAFVDIVKIITGTLAVIVIAIYLLLVIVFLVYYTIVMQVIRVFDVSIFKGYLHKFIYEYFLANEKDIRNWYMTPSYEQGNENNRPLLIPFSECTEGYKPGILFCHKISQFVPTYSYYANIYRKTEGLNVNGNVYMKEYKPDGNFHKFSKNKKKMVIKRANMEKEMYLKKMKKRLALYNDLTKTTCFMVDSIEGLDDNVKMEIRQLCSNLYCQNGNFETFCSSYNTLMNKDYNYDIIETYIHLTSYILFIIAVTLIITVSFHDAKLLKELPNNFVKIFKPFNKVIS